MGKPFIVERAGSLSSLILFVGLIMTVIGLMAILNIGFDSVGGWGYWMLIIGAAFILIGAIWLCMHVINIRKFNEMLKEQSKAAFVKKRDDIEFLAWKLPGRFESKLLDKEKGFGLK